MTSRSYNHIWRQIGLEGEEDQGIKTKQKQKDWIIVFCQTEKKYPLRRRNAL